MVSSQTKLVIYAVAVSAAHVELVGSVLAGVWHSRLYWTAVGCVIPAGLFGIRCISLSHSSYLPESDRTRAPNQKTGSFRRFL
jgi:hypothetical protein